MEKRYKAATEHQGSRGDFQEASSQPMPDADELLALASMRMPFGKYQGRLLIDLPEPYVVWFAKKGFPEGKIGRMLQAVYEIKVNGLEYLFTPLRPRDLK